MRKLAMTFLFLLLTSTTAFAQRGGGHGSGFHGGGFGGHGFAGGAYHGGSWGSGRGYYAGRGYYRGRSYYGARGYYGRGWYGGRSWYGRGWYSGRGWYGRGWYGPGWYGYGWGLGIYPGYANPYGLLDYDSSANEYPPYDLSQGANAQGALMAENALGEQIQRLSAEVDQLKSAQQPRPPAYPTPSVPAPNQEEQTPTPPPITLVLRTGQQLQVRNYAVMDHVFWDFTRETARKIPISSVDIGASIKATEANDAEFPQLSTQ
jgi:hypothetical protein